MALVAPKTVFVHIPKCAGSTIRKAIRRSGLPCFESGHDWQLPVHRGHCTLDHVWPWCFGRKVLSCIREPVEWYKSFWAFRQKTGWRSDTPFDDGMSDDINEWIHHLTEQHPGALTEFYESYLGYPVRVDRVLVAFSEDDPAMLLQKVLDTLRDFGESVSEEGADRILATPVENPSATLPEFRSRTLLTGESIAKIGESEHLIYSRFAHLLEIRKSLLMETAKIT